MLPQTFPKDGVKKLVLQMERQRQMYEEKAFVSLQKASQERSEALSRAETLQVKQQSLLRQRKHHNRVRFIRISTLQFIFFSIQLSFFLPTGSTEHSPGRGAEVGGPSRRSEAELWSAQGESAPQR